MPVLPASSYLYDKTNFFPFGFGARGVLRRANCKIARHATMPCRASSESGGVGDGPRVAGSTRIFSAAGVHGPAKSQLCRRVAPVRFRRRGVIGGRNRGISAAPKPFPHGSQLSISSTLGRVPTGACLSQGARTGNSRAWGGFFSGLRGRTWGSAISGWGRVLTDDPAQEDL